MYIFLATNPGAFAVLDLNVLGAWAEYNQKPTSLMEQVALESDPAYIGLRSAMTVLGQPKVLQQIQRAINQGWSFCLYVGDWVRLQIQIVPGLNQPLKHVARCNQAAPTWAIVMVPPLNNGKADYPVTLTDSWFQGRIFNGKEPFYPAQFQVDGFEVSLRTACDLIQYGSHSAALQAR